MIKIPTHVLLVDDEPDFVEMLALRLSEMGEKVSSASSGRQCLNELAQRPVDVVILDIKMPGMDGIETLREIKKAHPLVEVIMLTGHGTTDSAVAGMRLGAFDYLMKPADFEELLTKLNLARERKDAQQERIRKAELKLLLRRSGDL